MAQRMALRERSAAGTLSLTATRLHRPLTPSVAMTVPVQAMRLVAVGRVLQPMTALAAALLANTSATLNLDYVCPRRTGAATRAARGVYHRGGGGESRARGAAPACGAAAVAPQQWPSREVAAVAGACAWPRAPPHSHC